MRLKVKFIQVQNILIAEILEQEGIRRGNFERSKETSKFIYTIASEHNTLISNGFKLNICGTHRQSDKNPSSWNYDTEEDATEARETFTEMIHEINKEDTDMREDAYKTDIFIVG